MKNIAIIGSTGSIGTQTLDVIRKNGDMRVSALSAGGRIDLLEAQIREFRPALASVRDPEKAADLRVRTADLPVKIVSGMDGMVETAVHPASDILVTAISGMIGIRPTLEGIRAGKTIALANKETLVAGGHIVMPLIRERGVPLLPVDSEHSAVFQCLQGHERDSIEKLIITASGGPFRGRKTEELRNITVKEALAHPTWSMGPKITVDSATLVNKGLEVLEAGWLFGVGLDRIEVVVQPQSIVHSMVEFRDGAVLAQLGPSDMREPIQFALTYPERREHSYSKHLDFQTLSQITFEKPDTETFKGLPLAVRAGKAGGSMPAVMNAANEWAAARFLEGRISFTDIYRIIEYAMDHHTVIPDPDLETILALEKDLYRTLEETF